MQFINKPILSEESIKKKIEEKIPDANVFVADLTGTSSNFAVDVVSPSFSGKTKIQQHRMVYDALGDEMKNLIHALQVKTSIS